MSMTETKVEWKLYFIKIKLWDFIVMAVSIHKKQQDLIHDFWDVMLVFLNMCFNVHWIVAQLFILQQN